MATDLRRGRFLIADPSLTDPNFDGTVILLCGQAKEGSFGLVLNRTTPFTLEEAVQDLEGFRGRKVPLQWGGPVGLERLHVLHCGPDTTPDTEMVLEGVGFGGNLEALARLHEQGVPMRFFLGYAGWDAGQLEAELEEGVWRLCPGRPAQVFQPEFTNLWAEMMAALDPEFEWMRHLPPDPWAD